MKICIVGGGNIGTAMAVDFAHRGHCVNIFTSRPGDWNKTIVAVSQNGEEIFRGKLNLATANIAEAIDSTDYIFVTLPSNVQKNFAIQAVPFVKTGAKIVMIPGFGGAEFLMRPILDRGASLFGLQRVPYIARLKNYGQSVWFEPKNSINLAALVENNLEPTRLDMENLFDIRCDSLANYLCVTLTPSNPVLHTSRLYSMFKDFDCYKPLQENILFYAEWDNSASEKLLAMDAEVQAICDSMYPIDLRQVVSLRVYYESDTIPAMTRKLRSIRSLSKIYSPMKFSEEGWFPDFNNRYFSCDFSYGLDILVQFAEILHVPAPNMNEVMRWYRQQVKIFDHAIDLSSYGLYSQKDIFNYYSFKI